MSRYTVHNIETPITPNTPPMTFSIVRESTRPWRRGPIWPPMITPGMVYITRFQGTASMPPCETSVAMWVKDAENTVTMTTRIDVAAATGTGTPAALDELGHDDLPDPHGQEPRKKPPYAGRGDAGPVEVVSIDGPIAGDGGSRALGRAGSFALAGHVVAPKQDDGEQQHEHAVRQTDPRGVDDV